MGAGSRQALATAVLAAETSVTLARELAILVRIEAAETASAIGAFLVAVAPVTPAPLLAEVGLMEAAHEAAVHVAHPAWEVPVVA